MSILSDVIEFKKLEDAQEQRDVNAIGDAVNNFITVSEIVNQRQRQSALDELNRRNIESQIKEREKVDIFEQIQKINEGIEFANETNNPGLLMELQNAGKSLMERGSVLESVQQPLVTQSTRQTSVRSDFSGIDTDLLGRPTDIGKAQIEVQKGAEGQKVKAQEKTSRDTQRAAVVSDTAFDEVVRFNQRQKEIFGTKPGAGFGFVDKLTPKQLNEYKAGAVGAGREASATVGMSIIPAARAVRMVEIFAKSSAEVGNTIEGNANNVAASMGNVFGRVITDNILIETEDGNEVPIQSITRDPQTGQMISEITDFGERINAMNRVKRDFRDKVEKKYILEVFKRDPDLLQKKTVNEILNTLTPEQIEQLLSEG